MAFSEKIKKQARKLSNGICILCKKEIALEIHHIIPQEENGEDTLENAAPLCPNCHEIYGSNPTKRKLIRQERDNWYETVREAISNGIDSIIALNKNPNGKTERIAIYHVVYENEDFEDAANTIFELVSSAQKQYPGAERLLYLDIDGHRNNKGGFDADMFELQVQYITGFLMKYLTEVHIPLGGIINNKKQDNDIPDKLQIIDNVNTN